MDIFFEQIISKKKSVADVIKLLLIYIGGLLLASTVTFFVLTFAPSFLLFGLMICCFIFYGIIKLSGLFNIEFEYSVTNGTLDVDKIINRNSRSRLISVELGEVDGFEKYSPEKYAGREFDLKINASGSGSSELYCITVRHPSKGRVLVIFEPDDRVLGATKKALPFLLRKKAEE